MDTSVDTVKELVASGTIFIDVRTAKEVAQGRPQGSISIPFHFHNDSGAMEARPAADWAKEVAEAVPDKATKVMFSCQSGKRSKLACDKAQELGYVNVLNMSGGFSAWKEANLEII